MLLHAVYWVTSVILLLSQAIYNLDMKIMFEANLKHYEKMNIAMHEIFMVDLTEKPGIKPFG